MPQAGALMARIGDQPDLSLTSLRATFPAGHPHQYIRVNDPRDASRTLLINFPLRQIVKVDLEAVQDKFGQHPQVAHLEVVSPHYITRDRTTMIRMEFIVNDGRYPATMVHRIVSYQQWNRFCNEARPEGVRVRCYMPHCFMTTNSRTELALHFPQEHPTIFYQPMSAIAYVVGTAGDRKSTALRSFRRLILTKIADLKRFRPVAPQYGAVLTIDSLKSQCLDQRSIQVLPQHRILMRDAVKKDALEAGLEAHSLMLRNGSRSSAAHGAPINSSPSLRPTAFANNARQPAASTPAATNQTFKLPATSHTERDVEAALALVKMANTKDETFTGPSSKTSTYLAAPLASEDGTETADSAEDTMFNTAARKQSQGTSIIDDQSFKRHVFGDKRDELMDHYYEKTDFTEEIPADGADTDGDVTLPSLARFKPAPKPLGLNRAVMISKQKLQPLNVAPPSGATLSQPSPFDMKPWTADLHKNFTNNPVVPQAFNIESLQQAKTTVLSRPTPGLVPVPSAQDPSKRPGTRNIRGWTTGEEDALITIMEEVVGRRNLTGEPAWVTAEQMMRARGHERNIGSMRMVWTRGLRSATMVDERQRKNFGGLRTLLPKDPQKSVSSLHNESAARKTEEHDRPDTPTRPYAKTAAGKRKRVMDSSPAEDSRAKRVARRQAGWRQQQEKEDQDFADAILLSKAVEAPVAKEHKRTMST